MGEGSGELETPVAKELAGGNLEPLDPTATRLGMGELGTLSCPGVLVPLDLHTKSPCLGGGGKLGCADELEPLDPPGKSNTRGERGVMSPDELEPLDANLKRAKEWLSLKRS